jgi:hypothetical protein
VVAVVVAPLTLLVGFAQADTNASAMAEASTVFFISPPNNKSSLRIASPQLSGNRATYVPAPVDDFVSC